MSVEIKPGPELDRAVAEVIGDPLDRSHDWEHTGLSGYHVSFFRCRACGDLGADEWEPYDDPEDPCIKPYSTDLNAAFAAAERAGLFSETFWRTLGMDELGETWGVFEQDGSVKRSVGRDQAPTPALAICEAVLELKH